MNEITILGIATTILAMAVTYLAWKNGKVTRENTEKILEAVGENTQKMLEASSENTEKILKASSENTDKILKGIKESSKIIALLILSETKEEKKELAKKLLEL